jgi:hypothetical protein
MSTKKRLMILALLVACYLAAPYASRGSIGGIGWFWLPSAITGGFFPIPLPYYN